MTNFIPVIKWNDKHEWPPLGGLRHLIFHHEKFNFTHCIKRIGRRIFIDEAAFFQWMKDYGNPVELPPKAVIDKDDIVEILAHAIRSQMRDGYENEIGKAQACLSALRLGGYDIKKEKP